jgi:hypothetical protein
MVLRKFQRGPDIHHEMGIDEIWGKGYAGHELLGTIETLDSGREARGTS